MRRFELFLTFAALFAIGWPAVFGARPRRGIAAGLLLLAGLAQLRFEGYRWQLLPLYLAAVGLAIGDILFLERDLDWTRRIARGLFGTAAVALAASLALLLPVPKLPIPSGPDTIGTQTFAITDRDRDEIFGPSPGRPRELVVQVWYPALSDSAVDPEPIHPDWDVVGPALSLSLGLPGWFLGHVGYTESHTFEALPVAPGSYPVIVYSHGWTGYRSIALNQIETLVSNGYMVIAPDHTYSAVATVFPDGKVAKADPSALPEQGTVSESEYDTASEELLSVYEGDIVKIFDSLDEGVGGPFGDLIDSIDLTRIGVYGHSTGGGAAVWVCLIDERCDAVLGMDPWVEPIPDDVLAVSATRPEMFMRSVEWAAKPNDAILRGIAERSESVTYWIGIDGTAHNDFVMTPLLSPIADNLGLRGPIPAGRIIPIIDQYLVGFFDVFLLGTGSASIDSVSSDEVSLEIIGSPLEENIADESS